MCFKASAELALQLKWRRCWFGQGCPGASPEPRSSGRIGVLRQSTSRRSAGGFPAGLFPELRPCSGYAVPAAEERAGVGMVSAPDHVALPQVLLSCLPSGFGLNCLDSQ